MDASAAYFHHATPGLGPDIEEFQCPEWGEHQKKRAVTGMRYLDGELADKTWLAGEDFSVADITAYAGVMFAGVAKIDIPEDCANLKAWHGRMQARPSIAA